MLNDFASWRGYHSAKNLAVHCASHIINDEIPAPVMDGLTAGSAVKTTSYGKLGNRAIIMKVWRGSHMNEPFREKFVKHLSNELDKWNRVQHHPHVTSFLGLMTGFDYLPALVLPLHRNGNINEYLAKNPEANMLHLLWGAAEGLAYMHGLDPPVTHGGIRGVNILITDSGDAQLSDVCTSMLPHSPDLTMVGGELLGIRWMAPEVIDPTPNAEMARDVDVFFATYDTPKSDVYSFGMTILEVYTQKVPFAHRHRDVAAMAEVVQGVRPPRPLNCAKLTDEVWSLIGSCWKQDPTERLDSNAVRSWVRLLACIHG